jgi:hypothetical protein
MALRCRRVGAVHSIKTGNAASVSSWTSVAVQKSASVFVASPSCGLLNQSHTDQ